MLWKSWKHLWSSMWHTIKQKIWYNWQFFELLSCSRWAAWWQHISTMGSATAGFFSFNDAGVEYLLFGDLSQKLVALTLFQSINAFHPKRTWEKTPYPSLVDHTLQNDSNKAAIYYFGNINRVHSYLQDQNDFD